MSVYEYDKEAEDFNRTWNDAPLRENLKKKENTAPSSKYGHKELENFLNDLKKHGIISKACENTKISRGWVMSHIKRAPEFAKRIEVSREQSKDNIEYQAYKVAMGEAENVGDSKVLMKIMEANRPEKYKILANQDNRTQIGINISMSDLIAEARKQLNGNNNQ